MPRITLKPTQSALIVIDVQPVLMPSIHQGDVLTERIRFLARIARLLEVPVFATEQNPSRMGSTVDAICELVADPAPFSKMAFSGGGCAPFMDALKASGRGQVVLVGVETHICVSQTAQGLLDAGYEVVVCPDGVSARSLERHKLGMERIRDAGVVPAHTEAVAYEWLGTAEHPRFREALSIVKQHP
ncbi:isochorismatase family protein [Fimbriimonas ginsengisoli]|nr:isochorismatase family protein [Fimbriimonas ginsengisoli]